MAMVRQESGCKVGWEVYDNEAEAKAAAARAAEERERKAALGYDFGYQWPGSIQHFENHHEFGECWRVCTP